MKAKSAWTIGGVTLMVIMIVADLILGIIPTYNSIQRLDQSIRQTIGQNTERTHYLTVLRNRARNKDHFYVQVSKQRNAIPNSLQVVEFINQLDAMASKTGVEVSNMTLGTPQPYGVPASITHSSQYAAAAAVVPAAYLNAAPVTVSVTGSLAQIRDFLVALKGNERYLLSSGVTMQPMDLSAASQGTLQASITGQVFTFAPPEVILTSQSLGK